MERTKLDKTLNRKRDVWNGQEKQEDDLLFLIENPDMPDLIWDNDHSRP